MLCPICKTNLVMADRQGVEIDYCPTCRGVWLDRGELDKLIERSGSISHTAPQSAPQPNYSQNAPRQEYRESHPQPSYDNHSNHHNPQHHQKKKESWLGDIFDF